MGIKFGFATPTEASSLAVVYGVVLSVVRVSRHVGLRSVLRTGRGVRRVGRNGAVRAVVGLGLRLGADRRQPAAGAGGAAVDGRDGGAVAFLAGSVVLLVVIGSLLEGLPALIILAPLLLPIAMRMGVNPVQYGITLILAMGVGAFIPPIGVGFYVSAAVAGSDIESAARSMMPYALVLLLAVLLIAFVPDITLIVPRLIEGH